MSSGMKKGFVQLLYRIPIIGMNYYIFFLIKYFGCTVETAAVPYF